MRVALVLASLLGVLLASPSASGDEPAPKRTTWHGYLFKDAEGRTRVGQPVIAMGVTAMGAHEIASAEAARFAPLVSGAPGDYVFWNYELEKADDATIRRLP